METKQVRFNLKACRRKHGFRFENTQSYKCSLVILKILPLSLYQELHVVLLFANILSRKVDTDWHQYCYHPISETQERRQLEISSASIFVLKNASYSFANMFNGYLEIDKYCFYIDRLAKNDKFIKKKSRRCIKKYLNILWFCKGLGRPITDVNVNERIGCLMRFPLMFDGLVISSRSDRSCSFQLLKVLLKAKKSYLVL